MNYQYVQLIRMSATSDILNHNDFTQSSGNGYLILTISLLFPAEPEPDGFVTEASTEVICSPLESRPVSGHAAEDWRVLQMVQNLLDLIRTEWFALWMVRSHRPWAEV